MSLKKKKMPEKRSNARRGKQINRSTESIIDNMVPSYASENGKDDAFLPLEYKEMTSSAQTSSFSYLSFAFLILEQFTTLTKLPFSKTDLFEFWASGPKSRRSTLSLIGRFYILFCFFLVFYFIFYANELEKTSPI